MSKQYTRLAMVSPRMVCQERMLNSRTSCVAGSVVLPLWAEIV